MGLKVNIVMCVETETTFDLPHTDRNAIESVDHTCKMNHDPMQIPNAVKKIHDDLTTLCSWLHDGTREISLQHLNMSETGREREEGR